MKQYLDLLKEIKEKGTYKPPAREGMPGTLSRFGYQFRHDLQDGFPLLTTKKIYWKGVVIELLWFLRGDTNIKYLVDNGANFWNEDAYNYYKKVHKQYNVDGAFTFEEFVNCIKIANCKSLNLPEANYRLGDCGYQYGKVWRDWEGYNDYSNGDIQDVSRFKIDQIANLIKGLKENPESRRHIVTAIDPAHDQDLALYWCHAIFQFNCRPLTYKDIGQKFKDRGYTKDQWDTDELKPKTPKYYLDCQLYQRSADVVLGVPFNIASYALLTHILAKICNMIPGEFIHTFGDVHIYDNHVDAVEEQLAREPRELPTLELSDDWDTLEGFIESGFANLKDYNPHPAIKAELSTGLKK